MSGAGAGPAGVVGAMSGGDCNVDGIVRGGGGVRASLLPRSISIGCGSSGEMIGVNFCRKRRLRSVTRPDPSTLIWYWSCCLTSTTVPVRSHFFRVLSSLVLDADIVTHCQCGQAPGVFAPVLMRLDVPFAECIFSGT